MTFLSKVRRRGVGLDGQPTAAGSTPPWKRPKVIGVIAVILVVVGIGLVVFRGDDHGGSNPVAACRQAVRDKLKRDKTKFDTVSPPTVKNEPVGLEIDGVVDVQVDARPDPVTVRDFYTCSVDADGKAASVFLREYPTGAPL